MYTDAKTPGQVSVKSDDTLLTNMIGRAESNNKTLIELTRQLNRTADRILGSEPSQPECDAKDASPCNSGLFFHLQTELIRESNLLGELETAIRRLSVL